MSDTQNTEMDVDIKSLYDSYKNDLIGDFGQTKSDGILDENNNISELETEYSKNEELHALDEQRNKDALYEQKNEELNELNSLYKQKNEELNELNALYKQKNEELNELN